MVKNGLKKIIKRMDKDRDVDGDLRECIRERNWNKEEV